MPESATLGVLLDHTQDLVVVMGEGGRVKYANDAVERTLGYDPADLVGEDAFEYIHPDDAANVRRTFEEAVASDEFVESNVAYRFLAADGSWVWLESRMSNLAVEELDGYVVSSRDVTERIEEEHDHRETANRLKELAATTSDVLWMFDGDWSELLFLNPAFEEMYGRPVEDVEADPEAFMGTIHPDDVPAVQEAMERLAAGESVDMEYRINPAEDYGVWVWVQAEPIVEDGEVVRITGFSRDITDRRRRERQLYVMDNLLRHNLRNDLTLILGNAALIEENLPEAADRTAVIRRTGEDLLATAEKEREIIDLLTADGGPGRIEVAPTLEWAADVVREEFPGATVEVTCPEGLLACAVDHLHLALVELVENAVRHTEHDDPTVRASAHEAGGDTVVVVGDDAPPIPEIEARVLTGDYEMNDVYHSSGLGLWLVHWAVELSDGEVAIDSNEDGNEVRITLPCDGF